MAVLRLPFTWRPGAAALALALLTVAAVQPCAAQPPAGGAPVAQRPASGRTASRPEKRPPWAELTTDQQIALRPLAPSWRTLSEAQKRKWLALSRNFRNMSADDQARLHSRMTEWAALSAQQRTQARLNFAETKSLSADDKRAKWEAYQALSPEERHKLAAGAAKNRTPPTAAAVRPVPPQKLANVPRASRTARSPRIATGPQGDAAPGAHPHGAPAQTH